MNNVAQTNDESVKAENDAANTNSNETKAKLDQAILKIIYRRKAKN
ncbi:hypothetical protein L2Z40_18450 (plasmid) [Acinetobacter baumannii]|nr:hypothetical protein [Acinetobacter baumannii]UVU37017.1 hypothetical protein L2Z40_18450 [Acinetobacter baumannii]